MPFLESEDLTLILNTGLFDQNDLFDPINRISKYLKKTIPNANSLILPSSDSKAEKEDKIIDEDRQIIEELLKFTPNPDDGFVYIIKDKLYDLIAVHPAADQTVQNLIASSKLIVSPQVNLANSKHVLLRKSLDEHINIAINILGGAWAEIADLSGTCFLTSLQHFRDYLVKNKQIHLIDKLAIDLAITIAKKFFEHKKSVKKLSDEIYNIILTELEKLDDNKMLLIPGGWEGVETQNNKIAYPGHLIYYIICKDLQHSGKFIFKIINTGAGIEKHFFKINKKGKTVYSPSIKFCSLTKKQVLNQEMLFELMLPNILPLRHTPNKLHINSILRYDERYIYNTIYKYLPTANIATDNSILITPQRISNCVIRSTEAVIREELGNTQYKIFIINFKLFILENLYNNLIHNPAIYHKHHFLMIKTLIYSAQKIAKSLEKHKTLFDANDLIAKTIKVKKLLAEGIRLRHDYLLEHPGKLTDKSLPTLLTNLEADQPLDRKVALQQINDQYSRDLYNTKHEFTVNKQPIVIPKFFLLTTDSSISIEQFFEKLTECFNYASQITSSTGNELSKTEQLRAFLTNNIFDRLPFPPVFWQQMDGTNEENVNQFCTILELLEELNKLYDTTIELFPLPEHRYNVAKLFAIGHYLTKKFIETNTTLKDKSDYLAIKLPPYFNEIFLKDAKSLDPITTLKWQEIASSYSYSNSIILPPLTKLNDDDPKEYFLKVLSFFTQKFVVRSVAFAKHLALSMKIQQFSSLLYEGKELSFSQPKGIKNLFKRGLETVKKQFVWEQYFNSLDDYYLNCDLKSAPLKQSKILLDLLQQNMSEALDKQKYDLKLIANPAIQLKKSQTQLTLLLDYFESLNEEQQNDPGLLLFFKQIWLINIERLLEQLEQHPLLAARVIRFFNNELIMHKNNKSLSSYINKYVCLQRIVQKLYHVLSLTINQEGSALLPHMQNIYTNLAEILTTVRTKNLTWLAEFVTQNSQTIDKGQIATYGLATFSHCLDLKSLSKNELKIIISFSAYIGIYGFGNNSQDDDLLLKKDIYDLRLRLLEYILQCNQELKEELLTLFLTDGGIQDLQTTATWQENCPYFVTYDQQGRLIQLDISQGIILINGVKIEVIDNLPKHILRSKLYQRIFNGANMIFLKQGYDFIPQNLFFNNFKIQTKPNSTKINIFWTPRESSVFYSGTYCLLDYDIHSNPLHIPLAVLHSDFNYWIRTTNDPNKFLVLITPKIFNQEPKPLFVIHANGALTKISESYNGLSLSSTENDASEDLILISNMLGCTHYGHQYALMCKDLPPKLKLKANTIYLQYITDSQIKVYYFNFKLEWLEANTIDLSTLAAQGIDFQINQRLTSKEDLKKIKHLCNINMISNILKWQNDQGIITQVDLPIMDENQDLLSFIRKEENGTISWHWTKNQDYFISAQQVLYGRPSITNFILLTTKDGLQKALFSTLTESELYLPRTIELEDLTAYYLNHQTIKNFYINIDLEQSPTSQAKFIGSANNTLVNLYIVYLYIMQLEGDPAEANNLLSKQHLLRRYTDQELEMLSRIIYSQSEQNSLSREQLHPDVTITKLLAIYLVKSNLEQYVAHEKEKIKLAKKYPNLLPATMLQLAQVAYWRIKNLSKASGKARNNFSPFLSEGILKSLELKPISTTAKFKKLPAPFDYNRKILLKKYQISSAELQNIEESIKTNNQKLQQLEQEICNYLNDLSQISNSEYKDRLERKRISGHKHELMIEDAIELYLKQNAYLWQTQVGLIEQEEDLQKIYFIQDLIINYLLLKVKIQQQQRILLLDKQIQLLALDSEHRVILTKQLADLAEANRIYDPIKHPYFLVYEAKFGIVLRSEQIEKFKQLITEQGEHIEKQLEIIMGMGKSKILNPLLSYAKADGKHLSIIVLTDPLYGSGAEDLQKLSNLLYSKVETIEFSRQTSSLEKLIQLQTQINRAITESIICVSRVKDLQAIDSMPEVLLEELFQIYSSDSFSEKVKQQQQQNITTILEKIRVLLAINTTINQLGLVTLDEIDTQLYSRHQLNLPVGKNVSIPIDGIQVTTELFFMLLSEEFSDIPIKTWLLSNNQAFLLAIDFETRIKPKLAELIYQKFDLIELSGYSKQDLYFKQCFMAYMGVNAEPQHDSSQKAAKFFEFLLTMHKSSNPTYKLITSQLAIYKMQLADGKLQESLSKIANVQFGRSKFQRKLEIVIPYSASHQPKEYSELECSFFKDPWETVNKTLIYYISTRWNDLEQTKNLMKFLQVHLLDQNYIVPGAFIEVVKDLFNNREDLIKLIQYNDSDSYDDIMLKEIMNHIEHKRCAGNLILIKILFKYLSDTVFLEQIKIYTTQVNSTTQDFASQPAKLNGYSGTRIGEKTWHSRIMLDEVQLIADKIYHQLNIGANTCISSITTKDPAGLMQELKEHNKDLSLYSSFIDAGALFKEFSNIEVATLLLTNLPITKEAVAFYHEFKPGIVTLAVIKRESLTPIQLYGSDPRQLAQALNCSLKDLDEKLFNFYDQAHIIGSDLPNPSKARALMTFSEQLSKDLMNQGIMRMRKFITNEQHIDFILPEATKQIILKNLNVSLQPSKELNINHLIAHAILVQKTQEQQDYYYALHQKLQHEIKNYLTTTIRNLLSKEQFKQAMNLYSKTRTLILSIEKYDLFEKYGRNTLLISPISILQELVTTLKEKLTILFTELNADGIQLDLTLITERLEKIISNINLNDLPTMVYSCNLSNEEMEIARDVEKEEELAKELKQENQLPPPVFKTLTPTNNIILGIPTPVTDKAVTKYASHLAFSIIFDKPILTTSTSYIEYLKNLTLDKIKSIKSMVLLKIATKEEYLVPQYKLQAYKDLLTDNIFMTQDAYSTFEEIDPVTGIFSKYSKPINLVLIREKPDGQIELIILSAQESANFAVTIQQARIEDPDNLLLDNNKLWLVSPNGEALEGTHPWCNPFKDLSAANQCIRELLLQILVLQQNYMILGNLLTEAPVLEWFDSHKGCIKQIFSKEQFIALTSKLYRQKTFAPLYDVTAHNAIESSSTTLSGFITKFDSGAAQFFKLVL